MILLVSGFMGAGVTGSFAQGTELSPEAKALVQEILKQQQEIDANQAKINEKLDKVEEELRQARIYASRGGK